MKLSELDSRWLESAKKATEPGVSIERHFVHVGRCQALEEIGELMGAAPGFRHPDLAATMRAAIPVEPLTAYERTRLAELEDS